MRLHVWFISPIHDFAHIERDIHSQFSSLGHTHSFLYNKIALVLVIFNLYQYTWIHIFCGKSFMFYIAYTFSYHRKRFCHAIIICSRMTVHANVACQTTRCGNHALGITLGRTDARVTLPPPKNSAVPDHIPQVLSLQSSTHTQPLAQSLRRCVIYRQRLAARRRRRRWPL